MEPALKIAKRPAAGTDAEATAPAGCRVAALRCPHCDCLIEADSRYCRHCGQRVGQSSGPAPGATGAGAKRDDDDDPSSKGDVHRDPDHERQVWSARPSWRASYGRWLVWLLLSGAGIYASIRWTAPFSPVRTVAWLLAGGAAAGLFVREALFVIGQHYRLTTQRLFIHRGILTRLTDQMELIRIDDVRIRQGVMDRLVNTGDLEILGTDETDDCVVLESIRGPAGVAETMRRHMRGARSKDTLLVEHI